MVSTKPYYESVKLLYHSREILDEKFVQSIPTFILAIPCNQLKALNFTEFLICKGGLCCDD